MSYERNNLFLYEAIELRAEYDARIKTLKSILPENRKSRDTFSYCSNDDVKLRPASGFDVDGIRYGIKKLEFKLRKLL
ncbi:MAG: hypothetical protein ACE5I1_30975 [bacterium]